MLGTVWGLAVAGGLLGLAHPSPNVAGIGPLEQILDVARVLTTTALVATLVLGPGVAWRAGGQTAQPSLGFLAMPGLALLALSGGAAWAVGLLGWVHPRIVCTLIIAPELMAMLGVVARAPRARLLADDEWRAVGIAGVALGIAIGRALWSLGPPGELYAGTIYRTLEVGDRPDSRISFHLVELITNGNPPYGAAARSYFSPYTFSDRGPLPGLASAPVVLLSGGRPPAVIGSAPWSPFDAQGFMAYRLAMMTFASTCLLSLWAVAERVAGRRAARFAALLGATTPFVVHEIWFTWPKLLAASFVLLSALSVLNRRRFAAGLLDGIGYLCHPLALLSVPTLGLMALWPSVKPRLRRPEIGALVWLVVGAAVMVVAWRLVNGSHYSQSGFLQYVKQDGFGNTLHGYPVTLGAWLSDRVTSVANTLIPLLLPFVSGQDQEVNLIQGCFPFCRGGSPFIIHFFFQYWTGVPFGMGIVFLPLLVSSLWRALRRWPWAVSATVILPFVVFPIYWGGASTGLLREGMHAWVLTLLVVVSVEQASRGFPWLRSSPLRVVLALRALEVLLVAMLPTVALVHRVWASQFWLSDSVAVIVMVSGCGLLGWHALRQRADQPPALG